MMPSYLSSSATNRPVQGANWERCWATATTRQAYRCLDRGQVGKNELLWVSFCVSFVPKGRAPNFVTTTWLREPLYRSDPPPCHLCHSNCCAAYLLLLLLQNKLLECYVLVLLLLLMMSPCCAVVMPQLPVVPLLQLLPCC